MEQPPPACVLVEQLDSCEKLCRMAAERCELLPKARECGRAGRGCRCAWAPRNCRRAWHAVMNRYRNSR